MKERRESSHHTSTGHNVEGRVLGHQQAWNRDQNREIWENWRRLRGKIWVTSRRGGLRGDDLRASQGRKRGREREGGVWLIELLIPRNCFSPFLWLWMGSFGCLGERERVAEGLPGEEETLKGLINGFWEFAMGESTWFFSETFRMEIKFLLVF